VFVGFSRIINEMHSSRSSEGFNCSVKGLMLHFDGVNDRNIRKYLLRFALRRTPLFFQITSSLSIWHPQTPVHSLMKLPQPAGLA
jgi:hypothetical protein